MNLIRSDYDAAIAALFDRYYKPLVVFARDYVTEMTVAEDIVQEFFIKLWDNKHLLHIAAGGLSSYLFQGVKNNCITVRSRRVPRIEMTREQDLIPDHSVLAALDDEIIRKVAAEMERLPEKTRLAVQYVMLRNMKYQQAADALDISINTLKSALKEGLKRLRAALGNAEFVILLILLLY